MKIEEPTETPTLPPDFSDSLAQALNPSTSTHNASPSLTTAPDLPPIMAEARANPKTSEEILADLNQHPLFMTRLEENNDLIEALKALAYEGAPAEIADNFRARGNECFAAKAWLDAKEFYAKGVQVLLLEIRRRQRGEAPREGVADGKEAVREEIGVLERLLVNRAAAHVELGNYRSTMLDCTHALLINPTNIKALYRLSRALFHLERLREAEESCARGLGLAPGNPSLQNMAASIQERQEQLCAKRGREHAALMRKRKEEMTLTSALKARGIRVRMTGTEAEMEDARIALLPDPTDPTSSLVFPTVLLYPLHLQSDFIKAFAETAPLREVLAEVLPLPWDAPGEYGGGGGEKVECFMETKMGGLVKVGKRVSLLSVIGMGVDGRESAVEVVDGLVRVMVVPKDRREEWVGEWKRRRAGEGAVS